MTDYVLTVDAPWSQDAWDYLEHEVLPALQRLTRREANMASHEWNDDGESFHSLKARNDILAARLEELLAERAALQAALRNEFSGG
jgi:hypothetical protein